MLRGKKLNLRGFANKIIKMSKQCTFERLESFTVDGKINMGYVLLCVTICVHAREKGPLVRY